MKHILEFLTRQLVHVGTALASFKMKYLAKLLANSKLLPVQVPLDEHVVGIMVIRSVVDPPRIAPLLGLNQSDELSVLRAPENCFMLDIVDKRYER